MFKRCTSNLVSVRRTFDTESRSNSDFAGLFNNKVYNSVLEVIGNTPLIKLNKIPKDYGLACEIYAKCEYFNPSGSTKDRIALSMIEDARKAKVVNDETVFVEPTSENIGISIALNAALTDNKCIIVTGDKSSSPRVKTVNMLGAEVIQANSKDLETSLLQQLKEENPDTYVTLNEHDNDVNPRTHYEATGLEIVSALGNVDMVVMGAGSGGTMTGVAQRLKQQNPHCIVVAAEPDGSTKIRSDGKSHPFLVEEIGGKLTSSVLDLSLIDQIEMVTDKESFLMARELAKKEGLLCGGSSGTAMSAAIKAAKALNFGIGQRVVVILPDGIRNYMSTFVSDPWMEAQGFMEPPAHSMTWWNRPICDLNLPHSYPKLDRECTCRQALKAMRINKVSIAVIVDKNGHFVGVVSKNSLRNKATNPPQLPGQKCKELDFEDVITNVLDEDVFTLAVDDDSASPTIGLLSRMLDITPFVIIGNKTTDVDTEQEYFVPSSVVTGDDILDYIELTPDTRTDTGNKKKSLTT